MIEDHARVMAFGEEDLESTGEREKAKKLTQYRNSFVKFCVRNFHIHQLQACAIHSLYKLVQVNYFQVKYFVTSLKLKNINNKFRKFIR